MADKYYRLVSFLVNICPQTLRELFLQYMKITSPCTTLSGYLAKNKTVLQALYSKKIIRKDQWNLLFPQTGQVDESSWDTTLVTLLISKLFAPNNTDKSAIDNIRQIRNQLQHMASTTITDVDFDNMWKTLETATIYLAGQIQYLPMFKHGIQKLINESKVNNMPELGDTLRYWYEDIIFKLQSDLEDIKEIMQKMSASTADNSKNTTECNKILNDNTVTKEDSSGNKVRRLKTVDPILTKMNQRFLTTMEEELKPGFQSSKEIADVKTRLRDTHFVIVTGIGGSHYRETALTAIQDIGCSPNRCVEMRNSSEWQHIDSEEVDLMLCTEPFGDCFGENRKAIINDIFESRIKTARLSDRSKHPKIVIVSKSEDLHEVSQINEHDLLKDVVRVCDQTSENNPAVLTDYRRDRKVGTILENLLRFTAILMESHKGNNFQEKAVFDQAKTKLKKNKVITITGPRRSGKTSLALSLASDYQPNQILILRTPSDMKFVNPKCICILIIEDFPGKYSFDKRKASTWLGELDWLHCIVGAGQLNVIITCEETLLQKCYDELSKHSILENQITLKGDEIVVKHEKENAEISIGDKDVLCNEAMVPDEELDTVGNSSTVNQSDKNQPMTSFTGVKKIKIVDLLHNTNKSCQDFCQYIDGTYMFVTEDQMTGCVYIHHLSSDFQHIRHYQTDLSAPLSHCIHICCTYTGELVVTCDYEIHLCRITDGTFQLVKSKYFSDMFSSLGFSMNRISCLVYDTSDLILLDKNLDKELTVTLYGSHFDDDERCIFVPISNKTFVYCNGFKNDIVLEDTNQKQLKYLREKGFKPKCACAAGEDCVFVLGIQDGENIRILQVNTDAEILTDILIGKDDLQLDKRYKIEFDTSNSRLILLAHRTNVIREIYLK